jgi:hypothetical protein
MAGRAAILLLAVGLAGCSSLGAGGTVKPILPDLPAAAKANCTKPVARAGEDARAFAARAVQAFNCEAHTHDEVVRFYVDLQRRLAGGKA